MSSQDVSTPEPVTQDLDTQDLGTREMGAALGVRGATRVVHEGAASVTELVTDALRAVQNANPTLHAFVRIDHDEALQQAREVEHRLAGGEHLPLAGVTFAIKDNIDLAGHEARAGCRVLPRRVAAEDATAVARLRTAGAVIIGSAGMYEIALGGTGENPYDGDVGNPVDPEATTGGSSGGSAAAVAAGLVDAALGTDTAGSVRMPASLTGVVGLRPTVGTIPLHGVLPLAPTMDTIGPLTRTVGDTAAVWEVLTGRSAARPGPPGRLLVTELDAVAPIITETVDAAAQVLARTVPIARLEDDGWIRDSVDVASTTFLREAADLHESRLRQHPERFGRSVLDGLRAGAAITRDEYLAAAARRFALTARAHAALGPADVLLLPMFGFGWLRTYTEEVETSPGTVLARDDAMLRYVSAAAVTGLPAITVTAGHDAAGHPIGVQLLGAPGAEPRLFALAELLQEATG